MGFEWSSLHLQPAIKTGAASESYQKPVIDRHVGNLPVATGMQLSWIYDVPPPQQRGAIVTGLEKRYENYGRKGIYAINRTLLTQRICEGSDRYLGLKPMPDSSYTFTPPDETAINPVFRYLPDTTLPTGLATNQFGWR